MTLMNFLGRRYVPWSRTMEERLFQLLQEGVPYATIHAILCAEFMQGEMVAMEEIEVKYSGQDNRA